MAKSLLPDNSHVRFHTHETAGVSVACYLAALEAGADGIDTAGLVRSEEELQQEQAQQEQAMLAQQLTQGAIQSGATQPPQITPNGAGPGLAPGPN